MNNYSRYIASKTCLFANIFRLCLRTQFIHKLQKCAKMCSLASKSAKNVFFYTIVILRAFVSIRSLNMIWVENQLIICSFSLIKCTILILFFSQLISLKYKRRLSVFIICMENLNLFEFGNSIRPMDLLWCMYCFLPKDIPVKRSRFNMIDWFFGDEGLAQHRDAIV